VIIAKVCQPLLRGEDVLAAVAVLKRLLRRLKRRGRGRRRWRGRGTRREGFLDKARIGRGIFLRIGGLCRQEADLTVVVHDDLAVLVLKEDDFAKRALGQQHEQEQ